MSSQEYYGEEALGGFYLWPFTVPPIGHWLFYWTLQAEYLETYWGPY